jgi:hypothetical protein
MEPDEDIGDITRKQIIRNTAATNGNVSVSLFGRHLTLERLEKAAPRWLIVKWAAGQDAEQIVRETGRELKDIYRMLRDLEKAIIDETDDRHRRENIGSDSVLAHNRGAQ